MESFDDAPEEIRQLRAEVSELRSETLELTQKLDQERRVTQTRGRLESFLSLVLLGRGLERAAIHLFDAINSYRREKRSEVPASEASRFIVAFLRMALGSGIRSALLGFAGGVLVALPAWHLQSVNNHLLEDQITRQAAEVARERRVRLRAIVYSEVARLGPDGKCPLPTELHPRQDALIDLMKIEREMGNQIDLRNADLRCLNLNSRDLSNAVLTDADLRGSNLTEANLRGAFLDGVKLDRARIHYADFLGSFGLSEQALQNVRGLSSAKLPDSLAEE